MESIFDRQNNRTIEYYRMEELIKHWQGFSCTHVLDYMGIQTILKSNEQFFMASKLKSPKERLACMTNAYITENILMKEFLPYLGDFEFCDPDREYLYEGSGTTSPDFIGRFYHRPDEGVESVELKNVKFAANGKCLKWYLDSGLARGILKLHGADVLLVYVEREDSLYFVELHYKNTKDCDPEIGDITKLCNNCGISSRLLLAERL